jgi:hypothetical protein
MGFLLQQGRAGRIGETSAPQGYMRGETITSQAAQGFDRLKTGRTNTG